MRERGRFMSRSVTLSLAPLTADRESPVRMLVRIGPLDLHEMCSSRTNTAKDSTRAT